MTSEAMSTTSQVILSAKETLAGHKDLMERVRAGREARRDFLLHDFRYPDEADSLLTLPDLPEAPLSPTPSPPPITPPDPHLERQVAQLKRTDLPGAKLARVARYQNYIPEEETIRNDYSQHYVDSGEWPQNWVLGAELGKRFEEYPKQQKLLALKKAAVDMHSNKPSYLPMSSISTLHPLKFDVIVIDPPYSEVSWEELMELPIPALSAEPSFIFLWVGHGSSDGLERGRELLAKWNFRRCEDIVWVKTNKTSNRGPGSDPPPMGGVLTRTKEHCLMGIRGTVRRSTDGWFVHCNIDTDVIIWEGDPTDPLRKPPEMYTLIENFCLGTRRLELFGRASSLRRGWVTALQQDHMSAQSSEIETSGAIPWDREWWEAEVKHNGPSVVPTTPEIDNLRPKSPVRGDRSGNNPPQNHGNPMMQNPSIRMPNPMAFNPAMNPMMGGPGMQMGPGVMMPAYATGGFEGIPMAMNNPGMPMMGGMGMAGPMGGMQAVPVAQSGQRHMPMQMNTPTMLPPMRLGGGPMQGGLPGAGMGMINQGTMGMVPAGRGDGQMYMQMQMQRHSNNPNGGIPMMPQPMGMMNQAVGVPMGMRMGPTGRVNQNQYGQGNMGWNQGHAGRGF